MKLKMLTPCDSTLEVMYRYDSVRWSFGCDEFDNPYPGHNLTVELYTYPITKRTPKGVWIDYFGTRKLILNDSRKRFACETLELAKESFRRRKLKQRRILQAQLDDVNLALELISANGTVSIDPSTVVLPTGLSTEIAPLPATDNPPGPS